MEGEEVGGDSGTPEEGGGEERTGVHVSLIIDSWSSSLMGDEVGDNIVKEMESSPSGEIRHRLRG